MDSVFRTAAFDWGYALEGRANLGKGTNVQLIEANIKVKYAMFEAKLGRSKDVMGLNGDTLLSSGNFAVSGNALGIPVLDLRIPDYCRIPIFGGLISIKGNFANGYLGKMAVGEGQFKKPIFNNRLETLYHQKSMYGRIGKPSWRVNFYGGFNHQAQYGTERRVYGKIYGLSTLETLWYVMWGKAYGTKGIPYSKLGNQLGSIDLGISYDWNTIQVMGYRQNLYDVGALSKLANITDGLNGITFTNKKFAHSNKKWDWHKVLVEFFYSKDQAGYPWSIRTKSGNENYYNNYYYREGWSYKGLGVGTPLIIAANTAKEGQALFPAHYFISNRVQAWHLGMSGKADGWLVNSKFTVANHYGTFSTSKYGGSLGNTHYPPYKDQFVPVTQFSGYIQGEKEIKNRLFLGFTAAADFGKMFHNSVGIQASLRKTFAY